MIHLVLDLKIQNRQGSGPVHTDKVAMSFIKQRDYNLSKYTFFNAYEIHYQFFFFLHAIMILLKIAH